MVRVDDGPERCLAGEAGVVDPVCLPECRPPLPLLAPIEVNLCTGDERGAHCAGCAGVRKPFPRPGRAVVRQRQVGVHVGAVYPGGRTEPLIQEMDGVAGKAKGLAAASRPGHPWGRPVSPTDRAALPIGGDRLWLEFFGAWPREDTGRVLAAVCSTECSSPPRPAECSPPPWPPTDANGSGSGGGDGRRTNRRARRLRTPPRRPTRSPAHPWVCIRLQPATADAPYLHARPWMDPARGVTARSAADLAGRIGEARREAVCGDGMPVASAPVYGHSAPCSSIAYRVRPARQEPDVTDASG